MKKISVCSLKVWTIKGLIISGIFLLIAVTLNITLGASYLWKYVVTFSIYGLALIMLINSLFMSKYRFEKFRYKIDEEKIILRYGVFNEKNVVIPMQRVQFVDIQQGIILKKYKLINLNIYTAGGHYVIPYLESEVGKRAQLCIAKNIIQERGI